MPAEHRRETEKPGEGHLGSDLNHFVTNWPEIKHHYWDNPTCGGLNIGADATAYLGWYIGVLATEYRLRMNHGTGVDPQSILDELWSALEAYERLDKMAETVLGHEPNFNGYFLRDDVIFDMAMRDDNGDGEPNFPGVDCALGKFEFMAATIPANAVFNDFENNPYDVTVINETKYDNSPSGDQIKCLLMGLALVKACVNEEATINGQSVRLKAQNIAHLIGKYARSHDFKMKNANGNSNAGTTNLLTASYPLATTINWITENNNQNLDLNQDGLPGDALEDYHSIHIFGLPYIGLEPSTRGLWKTLWKEMITQWSIYYTDPIPNWPPGGEICAYDALALIATPSFPAAAALLPIETMETVNNSCWNMEEPAHLNSLFMNAAISNRWVRSEFRDVAHDIGMEIYPLLSDVLYNEGKMNEGCKQKCKEMIDLAPCDYFYSCDESIGCYQPPFAPPDSFDWSCGRVHTPGIDGWESTNRYEHKNDVDGTHNCKHNGLDFLLLYNLYYLKYPDELPSAGYNNIYEGLLHTADVMPEGDEWSNTFSTWTNCTDCQHLPRKSWCNGEIWSNDKLGSIDGYLQNSVSGIYESHTFLGEAEYRAGEQIIFFEGFEVTDGASMHAYIEPFECQGNVLMRLGEDEGFTEEEISHETNLDKRGDESLFTVYPNPNSGSFTISASEIATVYISDVSGKLIQTINGGLRNQVEVTGLSSGLYLIRAQMADGSVENAKVVVN